MSRNDRNTPAADPRPCADETVIREMYGKAAGHQARAAEHAAAASRAVEEAQQHAAAYVAKAQETAAEMVRQAKAQADADVAEAQARARLILVDRDEETKSERYWASLASEEAVKAGLSQASTTETSVDGKLAAQGGGQPS